jgi:chloramphenicol-sensitive protein RarD
MGEAGKGVVALVVACTVWGLSPVYYVQVVHVPPLTVLAWRTLWSLAFFTLVLGARGQLGALRAAFAGRRAAATTVAAALLVSANWFGFILAVSTGRTVESSLGYFIFPLVAVALGRIVLGERLAALQWWAVALATLAVIVLTLGLGTAPWIALWLAVTFGLYGLVKARFALGPVVSVAAEVLLLAPLALLIVLRSEIALDLRTHLLLALSGLLTGGPLALFAYAARRVRLSTLGLGQYVNPTLQFFVAVFWFAEPFTPWHAIAFLMIWLGLGLYSVSRIAQDRAARRSDSSAGTSATIVANP